MNRAVALYGTGSMYANGLGVDQDDLKAYMFFNISAENGSEVARESRNGMSESLTAEQINKAQEMAQKWMEKYSP